MTRFLSAADIIELASHDVVLSAARAAVAADAEGTAIAPPRLDVDLPRGFFRVMPGAVRDLMGVKVMANVEGIGNRYLLLLYHQLDGELLAVLDADEITRLRTAGMTAIAATLLQPEPETEVSVIGSGFEATGHLRALAKIWPLTRASVFSPSEDRRCAFATAMSAELGIEVVAVDSADEACEAADTVLLATKATVPVLDGARLRRGAVVLSIGSTRPKLRELDRATLARSSLLLVDDIASVRSESGDIIDALEHGALDQAHMVSMGSLARDNRLPPADGARDLRTFKSVGTVVQDLALASALVAAADGAGRELGELTRLKPFSSATKSAPRVADARPLAAEAQEL